MPNGIPPKLCVKPGAVFFITVCPWGTSGYDRSGKCFRFDSNAAQPPVEWYLDPRIARIEHKVLFQEGQVTSATN